MKWPYSRARRADLGVAADRAPGETDASAVQGQEVLSHVLQKHRERLAALVAGGQAKQYLGESITVDKINTLENAKIEKLYARYETMVEAGRGLGGGHLLLALRPTSLSCMPLAVLLASSTTVMACYWHG